jgi:hypothetical protein
MIDRGNLGNCYRLLVDYSVIFPSFSDQYRRFFLKSLVVSRILTYLCSCETTGSLLFGDAVGADGKLEVHGMDKLVNTEHICETI